MPSSNGAARRMRTRTRRTDTGESQHTPSRTLACGLRCAASAASLHPRQAPRRLHLGIHARLRSALALRPMRSAPASRLRTPACARVAGELVSSRAPAARVRLHSRPCLHNAPLCAGRRAHALHLYTKPLVEACARRPVRAARRTTRTMQNGRRQRPCASLMCAAPGGAVASYPCAAPARRPWLAR